MSEMWTKNLCVIPPDIVMCCNKSPFLIKLLWVEFSVTKILKY